MEVSTGIWSDSSARAKFYLDPTDPSLLVSRAWTDAEVADFNQGEALLNTNRETITTALTESVGTLKSDMAALSTLLGQDGHDAGVLVLADCLRNTDRALIAQAKISLGLFSDAGLGE